MNGARGNHHHGSRFDPNLFLADAGQALPFDVEDCLFNVMSVWRDNSREFNVSYGPGVASVGAREIPPFGIAFALRQNRREMSYGPYCRRTRERHTLSVKTV